MYVYIYSTKLIQHHLLPKSFNIQLHNWQTRIHQSCVTRKNKSIVCQTHVWVMSRMSLSHAVCCSVLQCAVVCCSHVTHVTESCQKWAPYSANTHKCGRHHTLKWVLHVSHLFMYVFDTTHEHVQPNTYKHVQTRTSRTRTNVAMSHALRHTATHCNTLHHTASHCITLQHTVTHCNTPQHTATHCNSPHHTATHCLSLQYTHPRVG